MPSFFSDRPLRRVAQVIPIFRDIPLRRDRLILLFAGVPAPQQIWPVPVFLDIPRRRWAQLFPMGPLQLWGPFVPVLPLGRPGRWERRFPVVRGGRSRKLERLPVFSGRPTRGDARLVPLFSGRVPRRGARRHSVSAGEPPRDRRASGLSGWAAVTPSALRAAQYDEVRWIPGSSHLLLVGQTGRKALLGD
jgi:hypothetical protein